MATVWRENRDVYVTLLSTMTSPKSVTTVQRRQHNGTTKEIECPEVPVYNKYMSGVDKCDQLRRYISQLDEAVDQSGGSPTKLIRNLLMNFVTPSVQAKKLSCFGTRTFPALNKEIIDACFRKSTS